MSARTSPADPVTYQGQHAGSVSRFTAYVIDLAVSTGASTLGLAARRPAPPWRRAPYSEQLFAALAA